MTTLSISSYFHDTTTPSFNWDWNTGTSWYYYVNSSNYKTHEKDETLVVDFLVAGLNKEDLKIEIEEEALNVSSTKPGWNGTIAETIYLQPYKVDVETAKATISNGVLRVEIEKDSKSKKRVIEVE